LFIALRAKREPSGYGQSITESQPSILNVATVDNADTLMIDELLHNQ
jgi:hypothetical protein